MPPLTKNVKDGALSHRCCWRVQKQSHRQRTGVFHNPHGRGRPRRHCSQWVAGLADRSVRPTRTPGIPPLTRNVKDGALSHRCCWRVQKQSPRRRTGMFHNPYGRGRPRLHCSQWVAGLADRSVRPTRTHGMPPLTKNVKDGAPSAGAAGEFKSKSHRQRTGMSALHEPFARCSAWTAEAVVPTVGTGVSP